MVSVQYLSLEKIASVCDGLSSWVEGIVGQHSLVMAVSSTGRVTFTKAASRVLAFAEQGHPVEKVIMKSASLHTEATGDGCEVFLLLLREILRGVGALVRTSSEAEVRGTVLREISFLQSSLPVIFANIRNTFACSSCASFHSLSKESEGLVSTFFSTKFSDIVSKRLTQLICDLLSGSISDSVRVIDSLTYLILNFDVLCSKAISPLRESAVLKGFVLHYNPSSSVRFLEGGCFVVLHGIPQKSNNIVLSMDVETGPYPAALSSKCFEDKFKYLKSQEVSLILTTDAFSDALESLCIRCGIVVISRIAKEVMDNILDVCNITPFDHLQDSLVAKNLARFETLESKVIGQVSFVCLKTTNTKEFILPHHIILCAPVEEIWEDYHSECINCLKTVRQWLDYPAKHLKLRNKQSNISSHSISPSGAYSGSQLLVSKHTADCKNKGSERETEFQSKLQVLKCALSDAGVFEHCTTSVKDASTCVLGVAYPAGVFEIAFKAALADYCDGKCSSISTLRDVLDSALLTVLCKIWGTPLSNFKEVNNYVEFFKKIKHKTIVPIEPASSKELLVGRILLLVQQLIRMDAILSARIWNRHYLVKSSQSFYTNESSPLLYFVFQKDLSHEMA
ncbi:uncharacterized protein CEXT_50411 [Caerostris extrusa]|uniref:Bardet-Biedl syndrome 10 protein n=1 Tax=Caerostris extrusa TaxID=172846 RepID=A0AAV4Y721_CAEEX|nr:uncharacterized protein CEXT_50411 [Caerostris extrusa]